MRSDRFTSEEPSVRYRGIFINDEDWGLQEWAQKNFESGADEVKDIGPKTYAHVFELLLRLKANFIWPAMHDSTIAFNAYAQNKIVADDYAIVMGSSHAEPMLRNNVYEWYNDTDPTTGQIYSTGSWNYSANKAGVYRYWEERAKANGAFENVFTMGKRGIHDSGMVEGANSTEKAGWLNTIFADQRQILTSHVNPDPRKVPQSFVPYKEVLDIYDTGLVQIPDDVTLVWPDDNHGYIRRLSSPVEQARSGGGGVYYHISYWGSPADYLWLCSIPPSLIWEEMTKAYSYNCGRIWVLNVGDIKPGEICTEFFLRLAWDVNQWDQNAQSAWLTEWAAREFGTENAAATASVLNDYYQLGYARKPEHMAWADTDPNSPPGPYPLFSHVHYGDEAQKRLTAYSNLVARAQSIYSGLPETKRSAFFQTVLYPVLGADGMNRKFINASKAHLATVQGRNTVASRKAASQAGYNDILSHTAAYNSADGGKWNKMMDAKPRSLPVFNLPALPADPAAFPGTLGVAVEGSLVSSGMTNYTIGLRAVNDGVITAPMIATNIGEKLATSTAGSTGIAYAPGAAGKAAYTFNVAASGTYALSFEINCPTPNDDSWHIKLDNGATNTWNNVSNGGVWTWVTYGSINLTAGQHTLTVYAREDGAAMANIRLTAGQSPALVEDSSQTGFQLPEFNRFTRRSHFIDLFSTGTNAADYQVTAAHPWLKISQSSGNVAGETRLWVSVDWTNAPQGEAITSSLSISGAEKTFAVPVRVWNPALQLPLNTRFIEDNHAIALEAEHYSRTVAGSDAAWSKLPNLGSGEGVVMISPVTARSLTNLSDNTSNSPALEYNVYLRSTGVVSVTTRWIPTLSINRTRQLRYAVSLNDETPQIVDMNRISGSGNLWSRSVLRSAIEFATSHAVTSPGAHTLKIRMVDPGVVLDRVVMATDKLPYTYGGPPETAVVSFGSLAITNGQTAVPLPGGTEKNGKWVEKAEWITPRREDPRK